jgi:hypothetical protein
MGALARTTEDLRVYLVDRAGMIFCDLEAGAVAPDRLYIRESGGCTALHQVQLKLQ